VVGSDQLPLGQGDEGEAVRDLQRRLRVGEIVVDAGEAGRYGPATEDAVRRFQKERGLHVDGVCGHQTWSALVEASYRLGARLIYHRVPMLRGDDVADLQLRLSEMGFDAGRVDGICGPATARALRDFQQNSGLTVDGICGPATVEALHRVGSRGGHTAVATVREEERLRASPRDLHGRRLVVGERGGLGALADAVGRSLQEAGAVVAVLHHPEGSEHARQANEFGGELYLGLDLRAAAGGLVTYYRTPGFESVGGRRLAELAGSELGMILTLDSPPAGGMRVPVLRETRMPAVVCELGPPSDVVTHTGELAAAVQRAVTRWLAQPVAEG